MDLGKLILVTNPGSSSRKYGLYRGDQLLANLHFEYEDGRIIGTLKDAAGQKKSVPCDFTELPSAVAHIADILTAEGYIGAQHTLDAIVTRIVAPMTFFTADHIIDDAVMAKLEVAKHRAPLHLPSVLAEVKHFRQSFHHTPIIAVSDSSFHASKPDLMKYYAFDTDLANKHDIKRYGYHGLSVGSIVHQLRQAELLPEKLIVCHVGSGSSITAVYDGDSLDTTMGYSPLEGVMMATRSGSLDVAAASQLKAALHLDDDGLEKYLNQKSGLLGLAGTDDMRAIIERRDQGDAKATFAHALYVYRLQSAIGQMAASLGGADAIVLTATILERNDQMRADVLKKLNYLGFRLDPKLNAALPDRPVVNIAATDTKPIYVIKTDETAEMVRRALALLN
jgi:acetate kinase